jgi:hypothetical protein
MSKRLTVAAIIVAVAVLVGLTIAFASVHGIHHVGPAHSGQGRVTEVEWEPAKTKCVQKDLRNRCTKYRVTKTEQFEVDYIDSASGQEREAHVSRAVFQSCRVGKFFSGRSCI